MNLPPKPPAPREQWFKDEVQPHDTSLRAYVRGRFPGLRDVDDVVQESFLRIWQARARQPIQSARAFLFRIARVHALNGPVNFKRSSTPISRAHGEAAGQRRFAKIRTIFSEAADRGLARASVSCVCWLNLFPASICVTIPLG